MRINMIDRPDAGIAKCGRCNYHRASIYWDNEIKNGPGVKNMDVRCVACGFSESEEPKNILVKCTSCYHETATVNLDNFKCSNCSKVQDIELPCPAKLSTDKK